MKAFLSDSSLWCGCILCFVSVLFLIFPPKRPNGIYGYRTQNSTKSLDRWTFSQKYSSCRMIEAGSLLILIGIVAPLLFAPEIYVYFGIPLLMGATVYMFVRTERALKKKFPN